MAAEVRGAERRRSSPAGDAGGGELPAETYCGGGHFDISMLKDLQRGISEPGSAPGGSDALAAAVQGLGPSGVPGGREGPLDAAVCGATRGLRGAAGERDAGTWGEASAVGLPINPRAARRGGWPVNVKWIERLWRSEGLRAPPWRKRPNGRGPGSDSNSAWARPALRPGHT